MSAVALFGTSADPPTLGHKALLQGLLALFPRVVTWASDNPMKPRQTPLPVRLALLAALVDAIGDPRLTLAQDLSSPWAIETLERARSRWPGETPVFVVGSDLLAQMPRWREACRLLDNLELAVAPRQGCPVEERDLEALRRLGARVRLLPLVPPATASSRARELAGLSPDPAQVPEELWPLLQRHGLYGLSSSSAPS
ncbi:MAG: nicotinate-nucleotide adenylyltransferase [Cyanobacteria bacterium K_Offshore_surface_m2_239]|nr:nicotinate-nucleotide adenylyltransferase [Cyanobacteria bacterium K_Offshore_surface_m2_239]